MKEPQYDLRSVRRGDILELVETYHGYKSLSKALTYCFAVYEDDRPIAAYAWQPPAFGAAKSMCPEAPHGVLALSRMVAIRKDDRRLKHVSKPLRRQMRRLIDRTRWPALVTYSDEGQGHNGFVYECSGWEKTERRRAPVHEDAGGARRSSYSNGKAGRRDLVRAGFTWIQRWENYICPRGEALTWMTSHGWSRVEIPGKVWASGRQAYTYQRAPGAETFATRLLELRRSLEPVFSRDLAAPGTPDCATPSAGHCAIVALLVRDALGGSLVSARVDGVSHWFNRLEGADIDLTGDQFGRAPVQIATADSLFDGTRIRNDCEINQETRTRYRTLRLALPLEVSRG